MIGVGDVAAVCVPLGETVWVVVVVVTVLVVVTGTVWSGAGVTVVATLLC